MRRPASKPGRPTALPGARRGSAAGVWPAGWTHPAGPRIGRSAVGAAMAAKLLAYCSFEAAVAAAGDEDVGEMFLVDKATVAAAAAVDDAGFVW